MGDSLSHLDDLLYEVNNSKRKWQGNLVPRVSPLASGLETLLV